MANLALSNFESGQPYPTTPGFNPHCYLNEQIQYIPVKEDRIHAPLDYKRNPEGVLWDYKPMAPSNVKHLYSPNLFDYEQRRIFTPRNTLYGHDFSQIYPNGMGLTKIIGGGHFKVWPLTNVNIRESREYTDHYFLKPPYTYPNEVQVAPTHLHTNWRSKM